jgi:hypothetical protein
MHDDLINIESDLQQYWNKVSKMLLGNWGYIVSEGAKTFDIMMAIFVDIIFIFFILPNYTVW